MKNRLQETINRYTAKCEQMKAVKHGGGKLYELCQRYGGSYYFYLTLLERGYLSGAENSLSYTGAIPTEKEMKSIIRHVNTLSRNAKPRKGRKVTTAYRHPSNKRENLTIVNFRDRATDLAIDVTRSITVDICLGAIEREVKAHRSNGSDATHIKNIARLANDLSKIIQ